MLTERLMMLRTEHDYNKKQMAEFLGIPYTTYNNYETGTREPNIEMLISISQKCNVSVDFLMGLTNVPTNDPEIKMVCDYTGLSDEAVERLHIFSEGRNFEKNLEALSRILEHIRSSVWLEALYKYIYNPTEKEPSIINLSGFEEFNEIAYLKYAEYQLNQIAGEAKAEIDKKKGDPK